MQSPFPGMDPYIERPAIWADFHDRLVAEICGLLQPRLRPNYAALVQDRLYVLEAERPIFPDVFVVKTRSKRETNGGVAVLDIAKPVIFKVAEEERRQPYLEIVEPAAGNRLITAIEVLSPDNKTKGPGRKNYLQKRAEVRQARASLVEIDLLRAGNPTLRVSANQLKKLPPWHYLAGVMRRPKQQEVYPIALQQRLPIVGIPLKRKDADIPLDLQAAFSLVWEKGPYPALLNYDGPPPGDMTPDEIAWCDQQLRHAGYRSR